MGLKDTIITVFDCLTYQPLLILILILCLFADMKRTLIILAILVFATLANPSTPDLMMTKSYCSPNETECPAGCCSNPGWYCCSDNQYCAATPNDCPNGPMIYHLHGKKVPVLDIPMYIQTFLVWNTNKMFASGNLSNVTRNQMPKRLLPVSWLVLLSWSPILCSYPQWLPQFSLSI